MSTTYLPNAAETMAGQQDFRPNLHDGICRDPDTPAPVTASRRFEHLSHLLLRWWAGIRQAFKASAASQRQLRLCDMTQLGDKRFVAVIQVEQERFLIGGAANSVALLARLSERPASSLETGGPERSSPAQ